MGKGLISNGFSYGKLCNIVPIGLKYGLNIKVGFTEEGKTKIDQIRIARVGVAIYGEFEDGKVFRPERVFEVLSRNHYYDEDELFDDNLIYGEPIEVILKVYSSVDGWSDVVICSVEEIRFEV